MLHKLYSYGRQYAKKKSLFLQPRVSRTPTPTQTHLNIVQAIPSRIRSRVRRTPDLAILSRSIRRIATPPTAHGLPDSKVLLGSGIRIRS